MSAESQTAPAAVLPIFAPEAGGDQRRGQAEQLAAVDPPRQLDAGDDVPPLVGAAHLQHAAVAAGEFQKVVGLQHHVVEFEKRQRLLAIQAQPDRLEARASG